jgi:arylsulfatase A-like enzyme
MKISEKKSVILITIDALRADHLRTYGYSKNPAPNLEKFLKRSIKFNNAYTNGPATPSSFSSIFTSTLPFLSGGYSPLPNEKISFPQILKENGIKTFGIHSNPNLTRYFNYDRGFIYFLDGQEIKSENSKGKNFLKRILKHLSRLIDFSKIFDKFIYKIKGFNKIKSWIRNKFPFSTEILMPITSVAYNAPFLKNKLIEILKNTSPPFFLWAHFMDVHSPYNPPPKNVKNIIGKNLSLQEREILTKWVYPNIEGIKKPKKLIEKLKILYDAEINYVDEQLSQIINFLKLKFKKDCLIIITSDHGESFYEHGLMGHQGSVFEELLRIPLFLTLTGENNLKKVIEEPVQLIDIAPTILNFFGIEIPPQYQGKNLFNYLEGNYSDSERIIFSECYQNNFKMKRNNQEGFVLLSIIQNEWKYIFNEQQQKEYLFNLNEDQHETENLRDKNEDKMNYFRKIRDKHLESKDMLEETSKISRAIKNLNFKI